MFKWCLFTGLWMTLWTNSVLAEKIIDAWCYYLAPPFIKPDQTGLAADVVNLLNRKSAGKYRFRLQPIPRARLNWQLRDENQGIVLFVNWRWMGENAQKRYLWTPTLWVDQNDVLSPSWKKIDYTSPGSLIGLRFGAIRGRNIPELESLFNEGAITRIDLDKEIQILGMLGVGRLDVTTLPRTIHWSLRKTLGVEEKIYVAPKPLFTYTRHIMVTDKLPDVADHLTSITEQFSSDPEWHQLLSHYGLDAASGKVMGSTTRPNQ